MKLKSIQALVVIAALLPALASAQTTQRQMPGPDAPEAQCSRLPELAKPALEFRGQIHVQATVKIEGGRAVMMEYRSMTGGVPRKELRKFQVLLDQHIKDRYVCATDGRLQKDFKFSYE